MNQLLFERSPADPSDAKFIMGLENLRQPMPIIAQLVREEYWKRRIEKENSEKPELIWIAKEFGLFISYATLEIQEADNSLSVTDVYVSPRYRGQGIGKKLLSAAGIECEAVVLSEATVHILNIAEQPEIEQPVLSPLADVS